MPPLTVILAAPFAPPLQEIFVCDETEATKADGWVMVAVLVVVQLFTSVTVQVYAPADKPVAVAAVPPLGADE